MVDEDEKERIRLAEVDLAQTNEFIKGVLATGAGLRASAITIWLALSGFAVQQRLAALGLLAAIVSCAFLLADGYHGWLYGEASKHARSIEQLLSHYYDMLSRHKDDPDAIIKFQGRLRAHRHGLFLGFRTQFSLRQLWRARPAIFYKVLYPSLIAVALALSALVGFEVIGKQGPPAPTRVIIERIH